MAAPLRYAADLSPGSCSDYSRPVRTLSTRRSSCTPPPGGPARPPMSPEAVEAAVLAEAVAVSGDADAADVPPRTSTAPTSVASRTPVGRGGWGVIARDCTSSSSEGCPRELGVPSLSCGAPERHMRDNFMQGCGCRGSVGTFGGIHPSGVVRIPVCTRSASRAPVGVRGRERGRHGGPPAGLDREGYKRRDTVERRVNRWRTWRDPATRYGRAAVVSEPDPMSSAIFLWAAH